MLRKIYKFKKFDEVLGMIGIIYFIALGIFIFFGVRFLVGATLHVLESAPVPDPPVVRFELELIEKIKELQVGVD